MEERGTSFLCFITRSQPLSLKDSLTESGLDDERAGTGHIYLLLGWHQGRGTPHTHTHTQCRSPHHKYLFQIVLLYISNVK